MKITRIVVKNYRGLAALEQAIPPAGVVVSGANGKGKTTFLKSVRAALVAQDVGADAIRIGEERAEILIDIDDISVRRVITQKGPTLTVTRGGMKAQAPQTFLSDLLGTSPLDPLDLLLSKAKDRRAKILEALPLTVTAEQLRTWAPDLGDVDTTGHGLEVLARVRAKYYADRTDAKKRRDAAEAEVTRATDALAALKSTAPKDGAPVADAERELADARAKLARLEAEDAEAAKGAARSQGTRDRIAKLRASAEELRARAKAQQPEGSVDDARAKATAERERVAKLQAELDAAKASLLAASDEVAAYEQAIAASRRLETDADRDTAAADDMAATLAETAAPPVAPEAFAAARDAIGVAETGLAGAKAAAETRAAEAKLAELTASFKAESNTWTRLETTVKALSDDAPSALLAEAKAIPGLGLDGDDVTLDGKKLDALCGAEQMKFAVEIARRLNARSKILIVDGLERLDPEQREQFVRFATSDGYQLLASLVDRGEPVFAAIEPDDATEAAAE